MKILIYTDVHWSQYSSILRKRGINFSARLENLIQSVNWAEHLAETEHCDQVITLGDFFDMSSLNAEELSALSEVRWANIPHYFLVGNHESNMSSLLFSSTKALEKPNFKIVNKPEILSNISNHYNILLLPYILEEDRKKLSEYITELAEKPNLFNGEVKKYIILSHNDIKGCQYGRFESKDGFSLEEISSNCNLFVNGHIHNGSWLDKNHKILNLGNLTGLNFSEDYFKYKHQACILDTESLDLTFYENPEALQFAKLEINSFSDLTKLNALGKNMVVSVRCEEKQVGELKKLIDLNQNILEARIVSYSEHVAQVNDLDISSVKNNLDYLKKFNDFVLDKLGTSTIVTDELSKIVGGN